MAAIYIASRTDKNSAKLQNEIQSFKAIIEKMANLPGAEPGREKMSLAFYPAETEEDLDGLLERAVQVSSWSSLKK